MMKLCSALVAVLLVTHVAQAALPTTFSVTSYDLSLAVTDVTSSVTGSVTITLSCTTATKAITFHWGKTLTPKIPDTTTFTVSYKVDATSTTDVPVTVTVTPDTNLDTVTLTSTATDNFPIGSIVTVVVKSFATAISTGRKGLFAMQYRADNADKVMIATDLRPTYAREVFPCLDEPSFPAKMTLTIKRPTGYNVGTSVTFTSSSPSGTTTTDVFTSTNALPPYALTILISTDLVSTPYTDTTQSPTVINVWTPTAAKSTAQTTQTANNIIQYLYAGENVLKMNLPQVIGLNIVLVPDLEEEFGGYGFVFLRYDSILMQRTDVIAEQILRQFAEFNARPLSWRDAWLVDAMAKYLQLALFNSYIAPYQFNTDLEVEARQTALALDSPTSRPVHDANLNTDSTVAIEASLMDPLKKVKSLALFSMLDLSLPAGVVYDAILALLANQKEKTITSTQFYDQIRSTAKGGGGYLAPGASTALTNIELWFTSSGYPLLKVAVTTTGTVTLTMELYCSTPPCGTVPAYSLNAMLSSKSDNDYFRLRQDNWVTSSAATTVTLTMAASDWVLANQRSAGYYRVQYSAENWQLLLAAVAADRMSTIGRQQIMDDIFSLAATGRLDYNTTLMLAEARLNETQYRNWYPVYNGLNSLRDMLWDQPQATDLQNFLKTYLERVDSLLTSSTLDQYNQKWISTLFLGWMCDQNLNNARATAASYTPAFLAGFPSTAVDIKAYESTMCCVAKYNMDRTAEALYTQISDSKSNYYQRYFGAVSLGCLSNYTDISGQFTKMASASPALKPFLMVTYRQLADRFPKELLDHINTNAAALYTQLGGPQLASLVTEISRKLSSADQATMMTKISTTVVDPVVQAAATTAATAISDKQKWLTTNAAGVATSLKANTLQDTNTKSDANPRVVLTTLMLLSPVLLLLSTLA